MKAADYLFENLEPYDFVESYVFVTGHQISEEVANLPTKGDASLGSCDRFRNSDPNPIQFKTLFLLGCFVGLSFAVKRHSPMNGFSLVRGHREVQDQSEKKSKPPPSELLKIKTKTQLTTIEAYDNCQKPDRNPSKESHLTDFKIPSEMKYKVPNLVYVIPEIYDLIQPQYEKNFILHAKYREACIAQGKSTLNILDQYKRATKSGILP